MKESKWNVIWQILLFNLVKTEIYKTTVSPLMFVYVWDLICCWLDKKEEMLKSISCHLDDNTFILSDLQNLLHLFVVVTYWLYF